MGQGSQTTGPDGGGGESGSWQVLTPPKGWTPQVPRPGARASCPAPVLLGVWEVDTESWRALSLRMAPLQAFSGHCPWAAVSQEGCGLRPSGVGL